MKVCPVLLFSSLLLCLLAPGESGKSCSIHDLESFESCLQRLEKIQEKRPGPPGRVRKKVTEK